MAKRYNDNDMKIDINNLTAYQEDHRIEAKTAKNQIPNNIGRLIPHLPIQKRYYSLGSRGRE